MFLDMMFSTDPFSRLTTSSIHVFPPSNSFVDHEKDDLYINHHRSNNNPFVSGHCFRTSETLTTSKQDLVEGLGLERYYEYNQIYESEVKKKRASKKDHHSKINTAQGPRDRRVRLSIEVAKKFFYLQDLLGFDKASKTLDWLFNKSKIQIDELVKRKKETSSSTVTDQSEVVFLETVSDEQGQKKKLVEGKRKKITRIHKSGLPHVNHSRAEARARARERTKEKLNIKKLDKESKAVHGESCPNSTFQSSFWSAIESQNHYNDKFGESIMEEKIQTLYSYQHNLTVSNDLSSKLTGLPRFTAVAEQQGDHTTI